MEYQMYEIGFLIYVAQAEREFLHSTSLSSYKAVLVISAVELRVGGKKSAVSASDILIGLTGNFNGSVVCPVHADHRGSLIKLIEYLAAQNFIFSKPAGKFD